MITEFNSTVLAERIAKIRFRIQKNILYNFSLSIKMANENLKGFKIKLKKINDNFFSIIFF